ncbi:MAG: hypothetical protein K8S94_08310 [Planctomycetia bacterium]|nr:hypothetical protein [Planctomycetia bacterium]
MAHLALVIDADPLRRERFVAGVRRLFGELPGVTIAEEQDDTLACVWATGPRAPVSVHRDADGLAIFIGYGITDDGRRITARDLVADWLVPAGTPRVHDGYHVGLAWSRDHGLAAGIDPMAMFPFQWTQIGAGAGAPLIAATTPAAFRCHPQFEATIDRRGLAGILLVHGPLCNRPLLAGTQRLPKGHLLRWSRDRGATEHQVYRLRGTPPPADETPAAMQERIHDAYVSAIRRHCPPDDDASILLSGGLDSRLVAATLASEGMAVNAIALGRDDDFEVIAAANVARRLGMPFETVSTELFDEGFPARTNRTARFLEMTSAPSSEDFAEGLAHAKRLGRYLWSGFIYDWTFEPVSYAEGRDPKTGTWALEGMLAYMNRWGVPAARLPALMGDDGPALCDALVADLRAACLHGSDRPENEACHIRWDQRVRNHVATACHGTSFQSWPLMPATDRRFQEAVFGLPPPAYKDRVIEEVILRTIRPDLCDVPLDTNSFRFDPLSGSRSWLGKLAASTQGRLRRLYWQRVKGRDPRRYERLFNVDHPRWMAVRRDVEPLRPLLHRHLDPRIVADLLPSPDVRTDFANPVNTGGAIRLLLSLAIVLDDLERPITGSS